MPLKPQAQHRGPTFSVLQPWACGGPPGRPFSAGSLQSSPGHRSRWGLWTGQQPWPGFPGGSQRIWVAAPHAGSGGLRNCSRGGLRWTDSSECRGPWPHHIVPPNLSFSVYKVGHPLVNEVRGGQGVTEHKPAVVRGVGSGPPEGGWNL